MSTTNETNATTNAPTNATTNAPTLPVSDNNRLIPPFDPARGDRNEQLRHARASIARGISLMRERYRHLYTREPDNTVQFTFQVQPGLLGYTPEEELAFINEFTLPAGYAVHNISPRLTNRSGTPWYKLTLTLI